MTKVVARGGCEPIRQSSIGPRTPSRSARSPNRASDSGEEWVAESSLSSRRTVRRESDKGRGYLRTATFRPFSFGPFLQTITTIRMERVSRQHLKNLCWNTQGQDVAEYAIMLAVVLVIVMGMVRMIGTNASTVFSQVGSAIQ